MTPYARKLIDLTAEAASVLDALAWRNAPAELRDQCRETLEQVQGRNGIATATLADLLLKLIAALNANDWRGTRAGLRQEMDLAVTVQRSIEHLWPGLDVQGVFQGDDPPEWSAGVLAYEEAHGTMTALASDEERYGG